MSEEEFSAHCAAELEAMIEREGADTIAAFIGEPVLGTGGIVPPPAGYWEKIQAVLKKHDILLIADEVVTGFGRLGTMFGSVHCGIEPDIITIAKGLTSAYAPLSGSIISEKVWKVLEDGTDKFGAIGHGWTYSAHPIGAAAAVANLKVIDDLGLVENAGTVGAYLNEKMAEALAGHANVGDVRGEGMLCAVELVEDKASPQLLRSGQDRRRESRRRHAEARRDRPRHAGRRHHRLRAAALPEPGRGRHDRQGDQGSRRGGLQGGLRTDALPPP